MTENDWVSNPPRLSATRTLTEFCPTWAIVGTQVISPDDALDQQRVRACGRQREATCICADTGAEHDVAVGIDQPRLGAVARSSQGKWNLHRLKVVRVFGIGGELMEVGAVAGTETAAD